MAAAEATTAIVWLLACSGAYASHVRCEYPLALEYWKREVEARRSLGDDGLHVARALFDLGEVYRVLGEYDEALKYANESLDLR